MHTVLHFLLLSLIFSDRRETTQNDEISRFRSLGKVQTLSSIRTVDLERSDGANQFIAIVHFSLLPFTLYTSSLSLIIGTLLSPSLPPSIPFEFARRPSFNSLQNRSTALFEVEGFRWSETAKINAGLSQMQLRLVRYSSGSTSIDSFQNTVQHCFSLLESTNFSSLCVYHVILSSSSSSLLSLLFHFIFVSFSTLLASLLPFSSLISPSPSIAMCTLRCIYCHRPLWSALLSSPQAATVAYRDPSPTIPYPLFPQYPTVSQGAASSDSANESHFAASEKSLTFSPYLHRSNCRWHKSCFSYPLALLPFWQGLIFDLSCCKSDGSSVRKCNLSARMKQCDRWSPSMGSPSPSPSLERALALSLSLIRWAWPSMGLKQCRFRSSSSILDPIGRKCNLHSFLVFFSFKEGDNSQKPLINHWSEWVVEGSTFNAIEREKVFSMGRSLWICTFDANIEMGDDFSRSPFRLGEKALIVIRLEVIVSPLDLFVIDQASASSVQRRIYESTDWAEFHASFKRSSFDWFEILVNTDEWVNSRVDWGWQICWQNFYQCPL